MSFAGVAETVSTVRVPRETHSTRSPLHHRPVGTIDDTGRLQSIVVPLDGTDFAEHAIPLAISIARRSGGLLTLVRAFAPSDSMIVYPGSGAFDVIERRFRVEARRYLDQVRRRIVASVPEITVITHLVEAPSTIGALARISKGADLVVMATRGRGWLGRFLFGSVSRDMLHERKKPMIYVRGDDSPVDFSADPAPRRLTVALDGSKPSERAFEVAGAIARLTGASSTLVHVDDPHEIDERFAHSSPESYLDWIRREFTNDAPGVSTHVVRNAASPARGILTFVDESEGDFIAVASRSVRPAFGSTTETLIRKSRVPVLVIRD